MKAARVHRLLLWCAATDTTFARVDLGGTAALVGKCIHCGSKLTLDLAGRPLSSASLEHIVPRTHGGTDALDNLAIACRKCNLQKGYRLDARPRRDPKLSAVIETLRRRRRERLREPLDGLTLPELEEVESSDEGPKPRRRRR
jgi:5-methylcytosine-specific restriction endonuclease McrA